MLDDHLKSLQITNRGFFHWSVRVDYWTDIANQNFLSHIPGYKSVNALKVVKNSEKLICFYIWDIEEQIFARVETFVKHWFLW